MGWLDVDRLDLDLVAAYCIYEIKLLRVEIYYFQLRQNI